mgnify:CR=1 FL=1
MALHRTFLLTLPLAGLLLTTPALADDAGGTTTTEDSGEEEEDEEDDKGCMTAVAPMSAASLALGVGIVLFQRRRDS